MKIAIVTAFYSEGMGYTENCLPRALAALGADVHVIASKFNVYGTSPEYASTYESFLGPADQGVMRRRIDGYTLHRLDCAVMNQYVWIKGLGGRIREIAPDVVHSTSIASLHCFLLAALKPFFGFKLFAENHQHLSVMKPFLLQEKGAHMKKLGYALTRSLPSKMASLAIEKCYAVAPDCMEVAQRFYGVPADKLELQSLGTDTMLFRPARTEEEVRSRAEMRASLGFSADDVVCVYTGRFSNDKNPLLLAQAIDCLARQGEGFGAIFVGDGKQKEAITQCRKVKVLPFMKHADLAQLYRAADIGVWPRQESMSMLDAAASGLPLVVSDRMGESERVAGNGEVYVEDDVQDLIRALTRLRDPARRKALGELGREKMMSKFSWSAIARSILADYERAGAKGLATREAS